jgi:hypothetical protein
VIEERVWHFNPSLVDEVADKVLRRTIPESIELVVETGPEDEKLVFCYKCPPNENPTQFALSSNVIRR